MDVAICLHVARKLEESLKCGWDPAITPSMAAKERRAADARGVTLTIVSEALSCNASESGRTEIRYTVRVKIRRVIRRKEL